MTISPSPGALWLMERLERAGYEAYVVGGCVRDALLGKTPHDWDITTSASPMEIKETFSGLRTLDMGLKHGTVSVVLDELYEITTFRVDGDYSDGRHPDSVRFSRRLEDDLSRRDFTINAMAYSPARGLVDAFDGVGDLQRGVIRCVGDAHKRIREDALRMLRAVRFQSRLNFSIDPATQAALRLHIPRLSAVSAERIGSELRQIIAAPHAVRAVCENAELLSAVVPSLADVPDLKEALAPLGRVSSEKWMFPAEWADENVRMALFFHRLCTAEDVRQNMKALKYSNDLTDSVAELVALRDAEIPQTRPEARRLLARLSQPQLRRWLKFREAIGQASELAAFRALAQTLLAEHVPLRLKDLAVDGHALLEAGFPAGQKIGQTLNQLLAEVMDETLPNERGALLHRASELLTGTAAAHP